MLAAIAIAALAAVLLYRDGNLHAGERKIRQALDVGFDQKQATVDGTTTSMSSG